MMGRPPKYTKACVDEICGKLAVGMSLREICRQEGMPTTTAVFNWLAKYPDFVERYARAKQAGIAALAEEIIDIADNGTNDWMERLTDDEKPAGYVFNGEAARRSQIRIDARKWLLSKLAPKVYGDKVQTELTGKDGGPVQISNLTDEQLAAIAAGRS